MRPVTIPVADAIDAIEEALRAGLDLSPTRRAPASPSPTANSC
ncbi:hypothetical protein ACFQX7_29950 [Luedemannella flava]